MMTKEQVEKYIRQMHWFFGFLALINLLYLVYSIIVLIENINSAFFSSLCVTVFALFVFAFLGEAFRATGTLRQKSGYKKVRDGSILLLLGFPILTVFGVVYLIRLSKPEMKAAWQMETFQKIIEAPLIEQSIEKTNKEKERSPKQLSAKKATRKTEKKVITKSAKKQGVNKK